MSTLLPLPEVSARLHSHDRQCRMVRELIESGALIGTRVRRRMFVSEANLAAYLHEQQTRDMQLRKNRKRYY